MPTEPIKPARQQGRVHSALPAMEKMQRLTHDRMIRREEVSDKAKVRAAIRYEGPSKLAHYHD